jgi:hypothetical protein
MYHTYCQFVDRQIDQGVLFKQGPSYFTGHYIDHFFLRGDREWFASFAELREKVHVRVETGSHCATRAVPVHGRPAVIEALQIQKMDPSSCCCGWQRRSCECTTTAPAVARYAGPI